MAGVRRRLRDVGTKVSGVLAPRPTEDAVRQPDPESEESPMPASHDDSAHEDTAHEETAHESTAPDELPATPVAVTESAPATEAEPAPVAQPEPAPVADPALVAAVDLARAAAVEVAGPSVGDHLGAEAEGPADGGPVVTHAFATTDKAYVGWHWAVTVARALDGDDVTVDEVVLLPGRGALLAPAWVPWSERVKPEDLGPGDLLPPAEDDPRLVPAYAAGDSDQADLADDLYWELGLGREHVLSFDGRVDAAERWWDGDTGPDTKMAKQAPGTCGDCGFLVPLSGALRQAFGVCANGFAPSDGRVVALAHGCGAFSETSVEGAHAATAGMAVEDEVFDLAPLSDS